MGVISADAALGSIRLRLSRNVYREGADDAEEDVACTGVDAEKVRRVLRQGMTGIMAGRVTGMMTGIMAGMRILVCSLNKKTHDRNNDRIYDKNSDRNIDRISVRINGWNANYCSIP